MDSLGTPLVVLAVGVVLGLLVQTIPNLLATELQDLILPAVSRRFVTVAAKLMNRDTAHYEQVFREMVDERPSPLSRLFVAIALMRFPLKTRWERFQLRPRRESVPALVRSVAAVLVWAGLTTFLVIGYPLQPARLAAYIVTLPLITLLSMLIAPGCGRLVGAAFGSLSYPGRMVVASLAAPMVILIAVAWGSVPARPEPPRGLAEVTTTARPPKIVLLRDSERGQVSGRKARVDVPSVRPHADPLLTQRSRNVGAEAVAPRVPLSTDALDWPDASRIAQPIPNLTKVAPISTPAPPSNVIISRH